MFAGLWVAARSTGVVGGVSTRQSSAPPGLSILQQLLHSILAAVHRSRHEPEAESPLGCPAALFVGETSGWQSGEGPPMTPR